MILRFRDEKIRRLEAVVTEKLPAGDYLIEENKRLAEELALVRAQIDRNPELTRFAMDNIRLMEQVRGYVTTLTNPTPILTSFTKTAYYVISSL